MEIPQRKILQIKIKRTISTRTLMYIGIYILFNTLCFFQLIGFSFGALAITCALLALGVFIRYDETGIYLFMCLAFFNVMNARVKSTSLFYLLCGIVVIRYLLQERKKYHLPEKLILLFIIFLATAYNLTAALRYVKWFFLLSTCIMLYHESIIESKIEEIITLFSIAFLMASAWGWLMIQNGMAVSNDSKYFIAKQYSYLRFAGLVGDSVVYAGMTFTLIALNLVVLLATGRNGRLRLFIVMPLVLCGILTYSKTFYLGLFVETVFFLWFWLGRKFGKKPAIFITLIILPLIAAGAFLWITTGTDSAAIIMRQRMAANDLSTGRLTAWAYYIDVWLHNWTIIFKGIGFSEYAKSRAFAGYTHSVKYAHNILIESVTAFGLLETIALLVGVGYAFISFLRKKADLFWLIPAFMLFVVFGMTSHGHFESFYYFFVLLVVTIPEEKVREAIIASRQRT